MSSLFETSRYSFHLPEELIADQALAKRDESRLLVVHRRQKTFEHRKMIDLPQILDSSYVLCANNTRVIRARLLGERMGTGGKVEFFMLKKVGLNTWKGLMKTGARVQPGFEFRIPKPNGGFLSAQVIAREEGNSGVILTALFSEDPLQSGAGEVPLPPYIVAKRKGPSSDELESYNTVFGTEDGSVAAPTAGRHFTRELQEKLRVNGIAWEEITLHVGMGTFKPVSVRDVREHEMHEEWVNISNETANRLNLLKQQGKKILSIGTTTTRALEGRTQIEGGMPHLLSGESQVNLFIHPGAGYQWKFIDAMLTNFHLPESTLLMMVSDFMGDLDFTMELYQVAIREQYRFYSYGDAMLILD
jgi:S-adenosylmethionine:tRNA ribosyltransferase-isomerase